MLTFSIMELVIGSISIFFAALQYLNATRSNKKDNIDSNTDKSQDTYKIEDKPESQSNDDAESQFKDADEDSAKK